MLDGGKRKSRHKPHIDLLFCQISVDLILSFSGIGVDIFDEIGCFYGTGQRDQFSESGLLLFQDLN